MVENFGDFVMNREINSVVENVDTLIDKMDIDESSNTNIFENLEDIKEEDLNEMVETGIIAGVYFVAFFSAVLLTKHIRIKRAEVDLKKKIVAEDNLEKKAKMQIEFDKLTKAEKELRGVIVKTEQNLQKSKDKLDKKQSDRAKTKVIAYKLELKRLREVEADIKRGKEEK